MRRSTSRRGGEQGEVVVHGGDALSVVADDPSPIVTDEDHLLAVGRPDDD